MAEENQRSFFNGLNSKSALILGLVSGVGILCTIGFFVMLALLVNDKFEFGGGGTAVQDAYAAAATGGTPQTPSAPPANIPKSDRPKVELFVMSLCPYGLQMQKAYVPAWDLLKKKADIDVKFVSYAMHGKEEVDENTAQYCIQSEQGNKYLAYLQCYTASGNAASCLKTAGVNTAKLQSCVAASNKNFGILDEYNNRANWLSGQFPVYPIHKDLNTQYGVQGSPTLVINGVEAQVGRTPEAIKQAICAAFNNAPAECNQVLSSVALNVGFGNTPDTAGGAAAQAGCGT